MQVRLSHSGLLLEKIKVEIVKRKENEAKVHAGPGFTFSFFFRIPPFAGNEISAEISPKFANSERKGTSNSKNEIPMNSDRNFGDFDRNSVIFDRKIM